MSPLSESRQLHLHFGREIYYQCQAALIHHHELQAYLNSAEHHENSLKHADHTGLSNTEIIRFHIEAVVTHAANLSRLFFSANTQRAAMLRREFSIPDRSPLANRKLRNAFQHHDERIDKQRQRAQTEPVYRCTAISANGAGHFAVHWYDGHLTEQEADQLMIAIVDLCTRTETLLRLTPAPRNTAPIPPMPSGHVASVSGGLEFITHAEYLRRTGQHPDTPYPDLDEN